MRQYEVCLRDLKGNRWSLMFQADSFTHAEEQAINYLETEDDDWKKFWGIIRIEKDYG